MDKNSKIYVAGHSGLVGAAIIRSLKSNGYVHVITRTSKELDLREQSQVRNFFEEEQPKYVFLAAAKVGGILANDKNPAPFLYDNLMIQTNVIEASYQNKVKKLLFLGSSCIYPKYVAQPMKEEYLLTGELEPTNEAYALAKITGIKMCEAYNRQYGTNYISVMPTNLYGPNDNFDLETSHVLPAFIRKFHEAKEVNQSSVEIWGTGKPKREFLHVDDLAEACVYLMENYRANEIKGILNIGTGSDLSIAQLAYLVKDIIGYTGGLHFNTDKPDGTPRKLLDVSRINQLGWKAKIDLKDGIKETYEWFKANEVRR